MRRDAGESRGRLLTGGGIRYIIGEERRRQPAGEAAGGQEVTMDRLRCSIRAVTGDDRSMLALLAEETLRPLASGAGHPERYHTGELMDLLDRADVFVAEAGGEVAGFVAVEAQGDALAVRCVCVGPAYEARGVANQLLDWAEGVGIDRGLARLTAYVPLADHPSQHLYRRHQFTAAGADGAEMVQLEKRLPRVED